MLFYDTPDPAPNPRRVRIFAAEKRIALPTRTISIRDREHRSAAFLAVNPLGQTPALELDDGEVLTESVAICRYLEALHPDPPLFGRDPLDGARIEMWVRRVELRLMVPVGAIWVHTHPYTATLPIRFPEYGEANRPVAQRALAMCEEALRETPYLAGEYYTMADIVLQTAIDFAIFIGLVVPEDLPLLNDWHRRVSARPSAKA
jgi:glutathione S-transferase